MSLTGAHEPDNGAVWVDGERTVAAHEDGGDFITAWAERWGFGDANKAMEAISEVQERCFLEHQSSAHETAVSAQKFYRNLFMATLSYKGARGFALDCACLTVGWHDIIGCKTQIELANKWRCTKANVAKCVRMIQQICGIPETTGQRDKKSREKMSKRRKQQLVKSPSRP